MPATGRVASQSTAGVVITSLGHDLERRQRFFDFGSCVTVPIAVIGGRLGTDPTAISDTDDDDLSAFRAYPLPAPGVFPGG